MKLKELLNIESIIAKHADKLQVLAEMEVNDLSISEMAFIKMVSSGSITTMKKHGTGNGKILLTQHKVGLSQEEKVKRYLKSLSPEALGTVLDGLELER